MNSAHALRIFSCVIFFLTLSSKGATVDVTYNFPTDVPITASSYSATGNTINFTLNCVPTANILTVVKNTGPSFIQGTFSNLAQGQAVALSFNSITYNFVANYYGGSGRDVVLVRSGARAFAAGANTNGQLGDNTKTQRTTPIAVSTLGAGVLFGKTVVGAAAGELHSLALCSDGTLAAWGFNYDGELGTNNITQALVPVAVNTTAGLSSLAGKTVVAVAAGELHSLALCSDGTVSAWGHNYEGELGNNSTGDSLVPVAVNTTAGVSALAGKTVTAIAAGALHNLALCADGTVSAWGYNYDGELGNNSATDSLVPVAVDMSGVLAGKTVVAVAAGSTHSLALCSDGTLVAWGNNTYGQLGVNTTTSSLLPVAVNTVAGVSALVGKSVISIAAGAYHSLALCSDGTVAAWGYNAVGQLGDNSTAQRLAPVAVNRAAGSALLGRTVVGIQTGQYHSVAQCSDGTAAAWGSNFNGQLGDNTTTQRNVPVAVATSALAAGERFVLAGSGPNASHTLGLVAAVPPAIPIIAVEQPVGTGLGNGATFDFGAWVVGNPVPLTFTIRNKGTSTLTGLTIIKDGSNSGEFVVAASPTAPVAPGSTTTFTVIFNASAAGVRTAALHLDSNDAANSTFNLNLTATGTLTGGVSAVFNSPTDVPISASSYTATGNTIDITLNCVPTANELTLVKNTGLAFIQGTFSNLAQGQAVTLSYAGITYNFVVNYYGGSGNDLVLVWAETRVFAWGYNYYGQLGDNTTTDRKVPVAVNTFAGVSALAGKTVISIAPGAEHSLALCSDGTVLAWGVNGIGQLGDNTTTNRLVPVAVNTSAGVSALAGKSVISTATGASSNLALCSDGTVVAWGHNGLGQLGDNTMTNSNVPVAVNTSAGVSALAGKTVSSIAAGNRRSLALCSDGTVVAWGNNVFGQLGDNTTTDRNVPVAVNTSAGVSALAGKTAISIASVANHSLALCSDGTVVAWGHNGLGQLGDNTTTNRNVPVAVNTSVGVSALAGKTVISIAPGNEYSLALCSDGTVVAWGRNDYGQLGDNTTTDRNVPVAVNTSAGVSALAGKTVISIKAGANHSLALCSDGTVVAWGYNIFGQLGDNTTTHRNVPVAVVRSSLAPSERFSGVSAGSNHALALVFWPGAPLVTSQPATAITTTGATLNGSVNANGNSPVVTFEYGTTLAYGTTVTASPASLTGTSATAVSSSLTGLIPGTLYHYRVNADNVHGDDQTFTALQSSNPDLAKLVVSEGALSPVFASGITQYTATVVSAADSITVIPTVADYGTVTVNGVSVATGTARSPIPLAVGTNTLTIVGTSQNGAATKTYTVTVTRPAETQTLNATWNSPTDVPATASHYTATGNTLNLTLNCIPLANELMILKNTGPAFIQGAFSNLAHGQAVALTYAGQTYNFVANYYGGNGNDLVLVWAGTRVAGCGKNTQGQIGDDTTMDRLEPVGIIGTGALAGKSVVLVDGGLTHSIALCSDGTVVAWGLNQYGEIGDNTITQRNAPVAVNTAAGSALFGKTVVAIAAGRFHSLALCSDGTVAAWGRGTEGQLGNSSATSSLVPVAVNITAGSALFNKVVVAVAANILNSVALCADGTVAAWGYNQDGELGDNTTTQRNIPVAVNTSLGISALAGKTVATLTTSVSQPGYNLALCSDGTVVGWGKNFNGELGNNSTTSSRIPVEVNTASGSALFGKTVVALAAGNNHSLALCSDGTVAAWGNNALGQLGNNSKANSLIPVVVNTASGSAVFGKTVVAVAAGDSYSLAVCSDGTVAAWGFGSFGALGNNSATSSLVPVAVSRSALATFERFSGVSAGSAHSLVMVAPSITPPAPTSSATEVSNLTLTSVQLNGSVNARGYDTTVAFEYGSDGITFPNTINVTPSGLNGISDVAVSTAFAGLQKGTTYYYRIRAANQGGITFSTAQSFITRTEPTAATGTASAVSTTSVQVTGTLNAHGSDTSVFFDYGTSAANLSFSVSASPSVATGYGNTAVSAVLNNLPQEAIYYRIRGTSVAGVGTSMIGTFQVATLSGFNQPPPDAIPEDQRAGFIVVNLTPSNIGEGWRFVGEQQWRVAGVPVGGLATGDREIEFRPVPGYLHPLREPVSVTSGAVAKPVEREYFQGGGVATASLGVTLLPASLGAGAQWRLLGEGDSAWRASGASLGGLAAGVYLVECKEVSGYATPRPLSVTIGSGEAKSATATYFLADAAVGAQPGVVGFDAVTSATANPSTYVGQLRSDSGAGTGFVVRQRVVATAAHVVFDDGTLSAATGLQWVFQRERGTYEPVPQIPRGSYILSGYSAQRIADATPGTSSVAAQNLDVASVWFYEQDAGRGGSGGYLASDSTDNEWLISQRLKTIVGYPLDGIATANQGRIHATPPINATFTHANARVFLTDAITSRGGNSGGPVCVQYDDGRYFPAAIYLGGSTQTRVRAIDSDVIALFDSAEESSTTGENSNTGGETQTNTALAATPSGTLTVTIEPQVARAAGAGWRIGSGAFLTSGQPKPYLSAGNYTVTFRSIEGFQTPSSRSVTITGGNTTPITGTYIFIQPAITSVTNRVGEKDVSFTHQITTDSPVTTFGLSGTLPGGLTFNSSLGRISGTPTVSGDFALTVNVANAYGGTDTGTLRIKIPPKITNTTTLVSLTQSQSLSLQITTPGDNNVSYTAPGLPDGITLNAIGLISGTPTVSGSFGVDMSATNAGGVSTHHLTINVAPQTIGASTASGLTGEVFSKYKINVKAGDTVTGYSLTGTLPVGLFFLADVGEIVGVPTESGVFPVTVSATNAGGTSSQSLTVTILLVQPSISSATNRSGEKNVSFTHQISTDIAVTTFSLTGTLPSGLTFDSSLGRISGTPTVSGDFELTVNVANAYGGTDEEPLRIKIPPKITNTTTLVSLSQSQSVSFQISTPGDTNVTYAASELPEGITLSVNGLISGTPTVSGSFGVDVSATNMGGATTQRFTINVAPQTSGASTASGLTGEIFSNYKITVKAGDAVTGYALSGTLPDGLFLRVDTGEIVGTPKESGIFPVTVSATNAGGTSSQSLTITILLVQPSITSATNRSGEKNVSFTHQISTDSPVTTFGLSGTLPSGLAFDSSLGRISGTPTVSGDFELNVNVANAYGGTDEEPLRIKIPPKITNTTTLAALTQSQSLDFQITTPGDNNVSYTAPGLPDGITLNASGLISGTPTVSGSFGVVVSATNVGGTTTHHLTINVAPQTIGGSTASGLTGQVFSKYKVTVKAGDTVTRYALSGALPEGLFFLADSGEIVGTPTEGGIFPVTVSATNAGGTSSQSLTITINPVLTFSKVGNGTVSPALAPATEQTPGITVTLTAQAAEGSFFAGWTGDVPSSERVLTFVMDGNRSVQANFGTFAAMKASYSGLVQKQQLTYSDTGLLTLTLTAKGSFSGKLQLAGGSYKVSGAFGADGKYSGSVLRGKVLSALPLKLQLGVTDIMGDLTLGGTPIPFLLTRPAFNSKAIKAPQAGSYTFTFPHPADTSQPQGDGYATVTVSASGLVALAGALGDGSVISVGGNLTSDGEWAVFATPYGGKGLFAGTLTFHDDTIDFVDGAVFWSKPEILTAKKYPGAFTADIAALGSRWTPPARNVAALDIGDWNLAIGNGILAPPLTATTTLSTANIFTLTGAVGTRLTLAPKTGLLSGSFPGASGKPVKFNGALLQSQRIGRGVFALPDKTGPLTLDPPP